MKKILLIILMIAIGVPAFACKKKKSKKGAGIVSIIMHRTACFGHCPIYKVELEANGMTTYRAIMFNNGDSGTYTKNIGAAKTAEIMNMVAKYRLDTCSENYPNRIPDVAGILYTIQYKNSTKKIYNAHFGPRFLKDIAGEMDAIRKKPADDGWKKISDNPEAVVK